jgi:putative ABC transport system ATP-binding protein
MATSLDSVSRTYGHGPNRVRALDRVSLRIHDGEFVAVMGPSGSGKSTLCNVIGALDRPDEGRVVVDGQDITRLSARDAARYRRRSVGFIFQSFNLLPRLTVLENVALPLLFERVPAGERSRKAADLLEQLGMRDRLHHCPPTLSGGEKQRVAIARALVSGPDLVLADEPTGNLDSTTAETVMNLISDLNHSRHQTVLVITHDAQVASHASRVLHMRDGLVVDPQKEARHAAS